MGEIADSIINGEFDQYTGEYIGEPCGYPRCKHGYKNITSAQKEVNSIRKELAILISKKQSSCTTEKEKNDAVNLARQEINIKYGKFWRDKEF